MLFPDKFCPLQFLQDIKVSKDPICTCIFSRPFLDSYKQHEEETKVQEALQLAGLINKKIV